MPKTAAKAEADARYNKKTYQQIAFIMRRDAPINAEKIKAHAAAMGESVNGFITRAVLETMERDTKSED